MLGEFKAFIARGNVIDLAVAVVIGAAFGKIVTSFTEDLLMPVIGAVIGNVDYSNLFIILGTVPETYKGSLGDYAALKAAGVPMIGYGSFLSVLINFLIIAFALFLVVRAANRMRGPEAPAADAADVVLLREIRDELRKN